MLRGLRDRIGRGDIIEHFVSLPFQFFAPLGSLARDIQGGAGTCVSLVVPDHFLTFPIFAGPVVTQSIFGESRFLIVSGFPAVEKKTVG